MMEHTFTTQAATNLSDEGQALLLLAFVLVQSGKYTQAMTVLEGVRQWETQSTACWPLLTQCYLELGLFAEALPLAQAMVEKMGGHALAAHDAQPPNAQPPNAQHPNTPIDTPVDTLCATRMLAQALWGMQRKDEARAVLEKALHLAPTPVQPSQTPQAQTPPAPSVSPLTREEDRALADA